MRKKPLTDTEVLFTHAKRPVRTHAIGDASLGASLAQRAGGTRLLEDRVGLDRAYQQGDSYTRNSTLYIAGSHTARDWYDDVTKIPFWGDVKKSHRYQQADKMLAANKQVTTVTGHSLGGAVAHELQRTHPELRTVTYGAPSMSWGTGGERYRNAWDPVSMFDRGATRLEQPHPLSHGALTHDYHNSEKVSGEDSEKAANPDGSVSITE